MKRLYVVLTILVSALASWAQVFIPSDMPNVQVENRSQYISDPANLLPADIKSEVNERLARLRQQTTVEAVVAIPPEIGDMEPQQWCEQLFTLWKIGKRDKDNGVLLMISPVSKEAFIMTGYGVEGVLTDIACNNIVNQAIIPAMRENNLGKAVFDATGLMFNALTDPSVAQELRSKQSDNFSGVGNTLDVAIFLDFIRYVALAMFLFAFGIFVYDCISTRRLSSNHAKSQRWRSHLATYLLLGLLSCGAGLIWYLMALWLYRSWRTRSVKCSTCGASMKRLPEDKDNELLDASQDFEEKLNTVDYDVWECPECGTIERYPYKVRQKKYTECPLCHTIAMGLDSDVVVQRATTRHEGKGVKTYECRFCHHQKKKTYTIPRKEDAAAIAGIAAGAMGMGRGGGGGSFGGGFGGGRTGGGGAGGRW